MTKHVDEKVRCRVTGENVVIDVVQIEEHLGLRCNRIMPVLGSAVMIKDADVVGMISSQSSV